jgi:hypothetical protein
VHVQALHTCLSVVGALEPPICHLHASAALHGIYHNVLPLHVDPETLEDYHMYRRFRSRSGVYAPADARLHVPASTSVVSAMRRIRYDGFRARGTWSLPETQSDDLSRRRTNASYRRIGDSRNDRAGSDWFAKYAAAPVAWPGSSQRLRPGFRRISRSS